MPTTSTSPARSRLPFVIAGAAVAAIAIWLLFLRGGHDQRADAPAPPVAHDDPWAAKAGAARPKDRAAGPQPPAPIFLRDADPVGALRLEGQVLDEDDHPVAGADVWLASVPPRQTRSEDDGSFAFDKLVGRVYAIEAHRGDAVGGPIAYTLTSSSDPAVVRLRRGQALTVIVTAAGGGKPIANARVELRGLIDQAAQSGPDGKAVLHGVAPGWLTLATSASGYAPARTLTELKEGQTEVRVQLERGAAVAGRVVDEHGAPIAKARVIARDVASLLPMDDPTKDGAVTDDQGRFAIASVAAGSYRFIATDDEHAPATSEPITVDGSTAKDGVVITMKAAAVLAGRVVTPDQRPAPYATVKVVPQDMAAVGGMEALEASARQVVADQDGAFALHGLPRAAVRVRAESDTAASAIADVDLGGGAPAPLVLVLDVSGTIAGVVVDDGGQPVAEAQVSALTDVLNGGKIEDLGLSGFATATTDGGGKFALHGLPAGAYRLWAQRGGAAMRPFNVQGTPARTGDTGVKIVLPAPGGIKGKVALDDGTPVAAGTVRTGFMAHAAVAAGAFEMRDLPPGTYDLHVQGFDFAETTKGDVVVTAGKTTDVGTITVHRGRKVTGRVVTRDGDPVAGAKVSVGSFLLADGKQLGMEAGDAADEQMGARSTTTGADGSFALAGVGPDGSTILADHPTRGRSDAMTVAAGTDDPPPVTLRLHGFGSLGGKVTLAGQPVASAAITVAARTGGSAAIIVTTGADGSYLVDRIPEGAQHVTVMRSAGFGASTAGADTTIVEGKRTTLDFDIPQGTVTLTVEIHPKAGAKLDAAQVFLFSGTVDVHNGKALRDVFLQNSGNGAGGMKFWFGADAPAFDKVPAGPYSICSVPITGDLSDARFQQRINALADKLDVYCLPYTVKATPAAQKIVQELPAMRPLDAPPP